MSLIELYYACHVKVLFYRNLQFYQCEVLYQQKIRHNLRVLFILIFFKLYFILSCPFLLDNKELESNSPILLRGGSGERGIQPFNFLPSGVNPWVQQRSEPSLLENELNQYQAMSSLAFQDVGGRNHMKQQLLQYLPQEPCRISPLIQQQIVHRALQQPVICDQSHCASESNFHYPQLQQTHTEIAEMSQIPNNRMQQQQSCFPSQLYEKTILGDPIVNFSLASAPSSVQGILGAEGNGNMLNLSRLGVSMISPQNKHQDQQQWEPKSKVSHVASFGSLLETENHQDQHNQDLFGVSQCSPTVLPYPLTCQITSNVIGNDASAVPYAVTSFQNSLYGYMEETSRLLQNGGETDPQTGTFVKVQQRIKIVAS